MIGNLEMKQKGKTNVLIACWGEGMDVARGLFPAIFWADRHFISCSLVIILYTSAHSFLGVVLFIYAKENTKLSNNAIILNQLSNNRKALRLYVLFSEVHCPLELPAESTHKHDLLYSSLFFLFVASQHEGSRFPCGTCMCSLSNPKSCILYWLVILNCLQMYVYR